MSWLGFRHVTITVMSRCCFSQRDRNGKITVTRFIYASLFFLKVDMILQEVSTTKDGKIKYTEMLKILATPMRDH